MTKSQLQPLVEHVEHSVNPLLRPYEFASSDLPSGLNAKHGNQEDFLITVGAFAIILREEG